MRNSVRWPCKLFLLITLEGALSSVAEADCLRHIYNRSPYTLVVTQDEGASFSMRPGTTGSIRLATSGKVDVAGYCSNAISGAPVVQGSFAYEANLDRCYFQVGRRFFNRELGNGFLPRSSDAPFALNNPKQGDLVLYVPQSQCLAPQ